MNRRTFHKLALALGLTSAVPLLAKSQPVIKLTELSRLSPGIHEHVFCNTYTYRVEWTLTYKGKITEHGFSIRKTDRDDERAYAQLIETYVEITTVQLKQLV